MILNFPYFGLVNLQSPAAECVAFHERRRRQRLGDVPLLRQRHGRKRSGEDTGKVEYTHALQGGVHVRRYIPATGVVGCFRGGDGCGESM